MGSNVSSFIVSVLSSPRELRVKVYVVPPSERTPCGFLVVGEGKGGECPGDSHKDKIASSGTVFGDLFDTSR